jgi:hypothetical protein
MSSRAVKSTGPNGSYFMLKNVDFGAGADRLLIHYANGWARIRLDDPMGPQIGEVATTAGSGWISNLVSIVPTSGVHDLYVVLSSGGSIVVDWLRFLPADPLPGEPQADYDYTFLRQFQDSATESYARLSAIHGGLGGRTQVTYGQTHPAPGSGCSVPQAPHDCAARYPKKGTGFLHWKVFSITQDDPLNLTATQVVSYTYSTPNWRYSDEVWLLDITQACGGVTYECLRRQWNDLRGHKLVTETDSAGNRTEYRYFQGMHGDRLTYTGGALGPGADGLRDHPQDHARRVRL